MTPSTYGFESDITPDDKTNETLDFKEPSHICISEESATKSTVNDTSTIISGNEGDDPSDSARQRPTAPGSARQRPTAPDSVRQRPTAPDERPQPPASARERPR